MLMQNFILSHHVYVGIFYRVVGNFNLQWRKGEKSQEITKNHRDSSYGLHECLQYIFSMKCTDLKILIQIF